MYALIQRHAERVGVIALAVVVLGLVVAFFADRRLKQSAEVPSPAIEALATSIPS